MSWSDPCSECGNHRADCTCKTNKMEESPEYITKDKLFTSSLAIPEGKPFPYFPEKIPQDEIIRMEMMMEINKWSHSNKVIAKRHAIMLIQILQEQFDIVKNI